MKEQREKLKQLCKKAISLPHFQRGYYGKGKTACNMASAYIAKEMGYDVQWMKGYWKERDIWIVSPANVIYDNAIVNKEKGIIQEVTQREAQQLAWDGEVVILTAKAQTGGRSGHIAVVYPTRPGISALKVCNVGWYNLICPPASKRSFGGGAAYLTKGLYFKLLKDKGDIT